MIGIQATRPGKQTEKLIDKPLKDSKPQHSPPPPAKTRRPVAHTPFEPTCKGEADIFHTGDLEDGGCRIQLPGSPGGVGQCAEPSQLYRWATSRKDPSAVVSNDYRLVANQVLKECYRPAMINKGKAKNAERQARKNQPAEESTHYDLFNNHPASTTKSFSSTTKTATAAVSSSAGAQKKAAAPLIGGLMGLVGRPPAHASGLLQGLLGSKTAPSNINKAACDCDAWDVAAAALLAAASQTHCAGGLGPALLRRSKKRPLGLSAVLLKAAKQVA